MDPTTVVSVVGVTKEYRLGRVVVPALKGVSIDVEPGEFVALCGPSGSGKTTLLNLMGCLDRPSAGRVFLGGRDVQTLSDAQLSDLRSRLIGFIFQTFNLVPVLTAWENVEYPLLLQDVARRERQRRVGALLEDVGLAGHTRHRPDELSGGQRQRVAIARALVTNPRLVLADEPTANLDSETGRAVLDLMRRANRERGATFVFSTHDRDVLRYAERIHEIRDGRLVDAPVALTS
jgi:putative ABC transport system ATP-binding protein